MNSPQSEQESASLRAFLEEVGASRFLTVRDGEVMCLDPESDEAQALYQQVMAALAHGTIRAVSPVSVDADED